MQLLTLGGLRLDATDFTRPKPLLLLCYLAIEGSQSRRVLADLFFADTKDPRDSLSTAYRHLRDVDEGIAVAEGARLSCAIPCDATRLIEALDAGLLEPAIDTYEGTFLEGLDLELGEELEEWVFATREYLAGRVREARLRVGEALASSGDVAGAVRTVETALDMAGATGLEPEEFPRVLRILELGGSPRAHAVHALADEVGIDLSELEDQAPLRIDVDPRAIAPNNLPPTTTSFVGRDSERIEIGGLLSSPHGRLITIHGPGGIGKSRLARRAARDQLQEGAFPDGVFRVELEPLREATQIPEAVAGVLSLQGVTDLDDLIDALSEKRMLLVFDGFEHLVDGAHVVSLLIGACPDLRVIVTSRTRLNLAEEHVLSLQGLALPSDDAEGDEAAYADAMQLVAQRAKKARLDFQLQGDDLERAVRLCRRLDGSPLAIELAMSWIRVMPLHDILAEIERDLSFLESSARNVRSAHESLRAVFERSWTLLSDREQDALAKLALFRGGFRREAATEIAGATINVLMRLVDASLVTAHRNGRYQLHTLIQQFCMERLERDPEQHVEAELRFHEYYRTFSADHLEAMYTNEEPEALATLMSDLPNVLHAWDRIFETGNEPERMFPSQMVVMFDRLGLTLEGARFYERALDALEEQHASDPALLRTVRANLAWHYYRYGRYDLAEDYAREAVADPEAMDVATMVASNVLALVTMELPDLEGAVAPLERAIRIAHELGDHNRAAMYQINLGRLLLQLGDFEGALAQNARAADLSETHTYPYVRILSLNNSGAILESLEEYPRAIARYHEALGLAERYGDARMTPHTLLNLAECSANTGEFEAAAGYLERTKTAVGERSDSLLDATWLHVHARIQLHEGNVFGAESTLLRAIARTRAHVHDQRDLKILPDLAAVWIEQDRLAEAGTILQTALEVAHPRTSTYRRAQDFMTSVRTRLGLQGDAPLEPAPVPEPVREMTHRLEPA